MILFHQKLSNAFKRWTAYCWLIKHSTEKKNEYAVLSGLFKMALPWIIIGSYIRAPGSLVAKNSPADVGDAALIPGPGRAPEEGNGNPLSILAWRIPCTEEPSALQSISSAAQSCLTLYDPMDCSRPGLPVHHQLPEFTQTHVHLVSDAIQSSHPLSSPSPPALNLSQHQGLFKWVSSPHQVAKVLELQLQHQSFQWTPRTDLL